MKHYNKLAEDFAFDNRKDNSWGAAEWQIKAFIAGYRATIAELRSHQDQWCNTCGGAGHFADWLERESE